MDIIQNVKNYREIFGELKQDTNNNFSKYLEQQNISIIQFLKEIGLNSDLIQSFNYQEIENYANLLITCSSFPELSTQLYGVSFNNNTITIDNKEQNIQVILNRDKISFNIEYDKNDSEIIEMITYSLLNGAILKKTVIIENIFSLDGEEKIKVYAAETRYTKTGEVLKDKSYEMLVDCTRFKGAKSQIIKALSAASINSGANKLLELLNKGYLKQEEVDIKFDYSHLQKK